MRRELTLLLLAACGRGRFDEVADATTIVIADAPASEHPCGIPLAEWSVSAPERLDDINGILIAQIPANGDRSEFDPVFSEGGLALHLSTDQSFRFLVVTARRTAVDQPFTTVVEEGVDINGAPNHHFGFQPLIALDRAVITAPYDGDVNNLDYWLGTRSASMWSWTKSTLSTAQSDEDLRMTPSGLTAYFVRGIGNDRDIYRAARASIDADFEPGEPVTELNELASEASPSPLASGTGIVFASVRPGGVGDEDIWIARWDGEQYEPPIVVPEVNSSAYDGEPVLLEHPDRCELVFTSRRDGVYNLWRSLITRR